MKKWWLSIAVATLLIGCGKNEEPVPSSTQESSLVSSSVASSSSSESSKPEESSSSSSSASEEKKDEQHTKRVGQKGFGFVSVPNTWQPHEDLHGRTGVQFADPSGKLIVTLDRVEESETASEHDEPYSAEIVALEFHAVYQQSEEFTDLDLSISEVASKPAYVITLVNDGIYQTVWLFDGADGAVHFILLEGTKAEVEKLSESIPASWNASE